LPVVRDLSTLKGKKKSYGKGQGGVMVRRPSLGKMLAAIVLALAGATLAAFVWPQMRWSDLLLRNGVSAEATVIALDADTCFYTNRRTNREYPCFRATGAWTHAGVAYRATLGFYTQRNEAPPGTKVRIIFAPDPAAAAGAADLQFRVIGAGRSVPRSERPVYLGLLALAGLMCAPLLTMLFKTWRRPSIPVAGR
jgi:hypothetical protein